MGADVRLVLVLLLIALAAQAAARVHTVLLTPATPSPAWLPVAAGTALNFTLPAGRASARVVQSSRTAPCNPLVHGFERALDAGAPFFLWQPPSKTPEEIWFYLDGECALEDGQQRTERLARRKDLDWAQLWGIVLGIAFGLVALAAFACCSWCCCFQHRVRAHQARLHVRDEGVQTGAAHNGELPLYERRVRDGEVQLEEAPAPDYHLATRRAPAEVSVGVGVGVGVEGVQGEVEGVQEPEGVQPTPEGVPLPPSPTSATENRHLGTPAPSADARHPPVSMSTTPQPYASSQPPDDLPPAYSHAPP